MVGTPTQTMQQIGIRKYAVNRIWSLMRERGTGEEQAQVTGKGWETLRASGGQVGNDSFSYHKLSHISQIHHCLMLSYQPYKIFDYINKYK